MKNKMKNLYNCLIIVVDFAKLATFSIHAIRFDGNMEFGGGNGARSIFYFISRFL